MVTSIFYTSAKEAIKEFTSAEFATLGTNDVDRLIDSFYKFLNYEEEGVKIRPAIYVTSNIHSVARAIPDCVDIKFYEDENSNNFNQRLKALMVFCLDGWSIYINYTSSSVQYGIIRCLNSIKDQPLEQLIFDKAYKPIIEQKTKLIYMSVITSGVFALRGIQGNQTSICFNINNSVSQDLEETINRFVTDGLSKLKTTKKKFVDVKNLYHNIFTKMIKGSHGTICLVVDKEFKDPKGWLSDGTWLPQPIEFAKLFLTSKSYNESKLRAYCDLLVTMLNYDGITIIDNAGRILAYNVFVESEKSATRNIIGGARLRAAYSLLNTKNKKIIGVYFQSQEGESFYKSIKEARADLQQANKSVQQNYKQIEINLNDSKLLEKEPKAEE